MRRILVTGANKGIGLAIVEAILGGHADGYVYLGSRDAGRGRSALEELERAHPSWKGRVELVTIDVADDASVQEAAERVSQGLAGEELYGVVNNAGIGGGPHDHAAVFGTNTLGVRRVCEAFSALLPPQGGRIVNVTSAAGPSFVATCGPERQRFFTNEQITWPELAAFVDECIALSGDTAAFARRGLGDGSPYGLSKACANSYTMLLARERPSTIVNACTPGFIETDMTRHFARSSGKSPAELGMKQPADGARAPLHLLFGALEGNGRFYGSDAKRSPLDRYRSPGSPEYTGR